MKNISEKNYCIDYSDDFNHDLKMLAHYYTEKASEEFSLAFVLLVMKKSNSLIFNSKIYPVFKKYQKIEYRKMVIKNYLVVYSINESEKKIYVHRLFNQLEDWQNK